MASRGSSSTARYDEVGPYKVGGEIGKGSFAIVYYGTHKESGAAVAVKSVDLARLNKKLKSNLYLEIKILRTLVHPHIVALHDCIETREKIHLMMEYCELGDLSLFIKKRDKLMTHPATHDMARKYPSPPNGGLNEVVIRHFLKQLSSALQFLRKTNLVHRDVKPQNLLLLPSVGYRDQHKTSKAILGKSHDSLIPVAGLQSLPMLKLGDFGFARVLPSTSLAETLCGSPLYMAPEILRYEKYDATADLWSVGTVLYEMVTGKPPFRANHHVELLRIIEAGQDQIRFSRSYPISTEMKALIRSLLKRSPAERLSFEDFFVNEIITGPIPGVVEEDVDPVPAKKVDKEIARAAVKSEDPAPSPRRVSVRRHATEGDHAGVSMSPRRSTPRSPLGSPAELHRQLGHDLPSTSPRQNVEGLGLRRPPPISSTSAPSKPGLMQMRQRGPSLTSSARPLRDLPPPSGYHEQGSRDAREKAAQEVAFERDYVVVDKDQVAVNALADELGRIGVDTPAGQMVRRNTAQGEVTEGGSRAVQIAQGKRPGVHDRRTSLSSSPGSATSFISKAIQDASLRLLGIKYPPGLGKGASPPQFQSPFPAYPVATPTAGLIGDGKQGALIDEDARVTQSIEDYANRGDVVYYFAEVKYKQLVPLAPSADRTLGGLSTEDTGGAEECLTTEAIMALSEEALVLFVKSLSLLAKSMEIAGLWWARKNRTEPPTPGAANSQAMSTRINSAVQWVRSRFNEVLEKVEVVRLKLLEAQKQLPEDHPSHPSNNQVESASGQSKEDIVLSVGVSAEKLMYDRAVEMSRTAAINEVANEDLPGCELSYITALRMLEAILDSDEDLSKRRSSGSKKEEAAKVVDETSPEIDIEDQQSLIRLITMVQARLKHVRNKMHTIASAEKAEAQQQQTLVRRHSRDTSPRSLPSSS